MFLHLKRKNTAIPSGNTLSDEQLVSRYLETGNKELIAILFERYTHLVYGICLNYLQDTDQCKDAVMEIFESLFHKLAVHKISNFRNWLYSVTKNQCLMTIRKAGSLNRAKNGFQTTYVVTEVSDDAGDEDDFLFNKDTVISAVDRLNNEQGTCIRLMYIEDKSYVDITKITGYSLNEVKSYIQNGKRNLKNYLLKQNGNSDI